MSLSDYFSPDERTERVESRAKDRAKRRTELKKRDKAREASGGLSFAKVGGAVRDVGLGVLGLTPKDKARQRKAKKAPTSSSGYSASGYASASAGTDKGGLMLAAGVAAAAALAFMASKKEG